MTIRVALADEHIILLEGLRQLLEPLCSVIGTFSDGRSLISQAEQLRPDVIVTDVYIPLLCGLAACERLARTLPESKVIFFTANEDVKTAEKAVRCGAFGYLLKSAPLTELFKAIQTVAIGRYYITPAVTDEPAGVFVARAKNQAREEPLTERQREVLQLLAEGKSMKEAPAVLNITARTIAFHKYVIMEQLHLARSSDLVRYAMEIGLCGQKLRAA